MVPLVPPQLPTSPEEPRQDFYDHIAKVSKKYTVVSSNYGHVNFSRNLAQEVASCNTIYFSNCLVKHRFFWAFRETAWLVMKLHG